MASYTSRTASYEDAMAVWMDGSRNKFDPWPLLSAHKTYVDITAKTQRSLDNMMDLCNSKKIPFSSVAENHMVIRLFISRDVVAEDAADAYMNKKYTEWDGNWNEEYIGFLEGWRQSSTRTIVQK